MTGFSPVYKIQGLVYHLIGSLLPVDNLEPKFAQIYFLNDREERINARISSNELLKLDAFGRGLTIARPTFWPTRTPLHYIAMNFCPLLKNFQSSLLMSQPLSVLFAYNENIFIQYEFKF